MGEEAATAEDMDMDQSRWIPFQYWGFCRWVNYIYCIHLPF